MNDTTVVKNSNSLRGTDVIATFTIPDELANELSTLLTKRSIRIEILKSLVNNDLGTYEAAEQKLLPVEDRISVIKTLITSQYVPDEYRSDRYTWFYAGYSIAGGECWIKITN